MTKKNRKARRLRELYPDVQIKVLYQRDYLHLLVKYGLEPPSQLSEQFGDGAPLRFDADVPDRRSTAADGRVRLIGDPPRMTERLRHSPLDAAHRALGARMVPFGGWEMPIQYASALEEHRACRDDAVVFDVSHLGRCACAGGGVVAVLQWALTNDLDRIGPGRAQYTHLLDDPTTRTSSTTSSCGGSRPTSFYVMPNASNTDRSSTAARRGRRSARRRHVDDSPPAAPCSPSRAPQARSRLAPVAPELPRSPRFHVAAVRLAGAPCASPRAPATPERTASRSTCPADRAAELWDAIIGAGVPPAGLGARDTLRLEAGLPLHGHELGPGITPLQAGLGWVVRCDKGDFRGREPSCRTRSGRRARLLRGLHRRRPPAAAEGYAVDARGAVVGEVTSGNFSPVLGHGIALGFLDPVDRAGRRGRHRRARQVAPRDRRAASLRPPLSGSIGLAQGDGSGPVTEAVGAEARDAVAPARQPMHVAVRQEEGRQRTFELVGVGAVDALDRAVGGDDFEDHRALRFGGGGSPYDAGLWIVRGINLWKSCGQRDRTRNASSVGVEVVALLEVRRMTRARDLHDARVVEHARLRHG